MPANGKTGFNLAFKGLMKLELLQQIFDKYSDIKFYENPSSESRVVPCGRTDRHEEPNGRFTQFLQTSLKIK